MSAKNDPNIIQSQYDNWDFLGGPVVKSLYFQSRDTGLIPGQETKIPQALQSKSKKPKKKKKNPTMIAMLSGAINSI